MKIEEDIKNIAILLLDRSKSEEVVEITIFASSDPNRHPLFPTYTYPESVVQMEKLKLLKIVEKRELGNPIGENSTLINFYTNYKIQYLPVVLAKFLRNREKIKSLKDDQFKVKIDENPYCEEEEGKGYLKYYKEGPKTKIGSVESEHYLFLDYMLKNINTFIRVHEVYKNVRKREDKLSDTYVHEIENMKKIIQNSWIKELQKGERMRTKSGHIKFTLKKDLIRAEFIRYKQR